MQKNNLQKARLVMRYSKGKAIKKHTHTQKKNLQLM